MKTQRTLVVLAVLTIAAMACQFGGTVPSNSTLPQASAPDTTSSQGGNAQAPITVQAPVNPEAAQDAFIALYKQVSPGVVIIKTTTSQGGALGSGFVYDSSGNVVTNFHVVDGAPNNKVEVDFLSGYKAYGTVAGTDLDSDLAVIKVNAPASELHPLTLGDSDAMQIGQTVIAIGNPFQFLGSMSVGVISGLHRTLDSEHATPGSGATAGQPFTAGDLLQTDTAINPGNSGGPLFNINGEVVGVNRAIETADFSSTGQAVNSGVGFSVSSNIIKRVVPVIIKTGKYDYPYLGISSISLGNPSRGGLSLDEINALGLKQFTGTYVTETVPGGPADKAGIKVGTQLTSIQNLKAGGDLIVAIDGRPVIQYDDLISYLITHKSPGDTVVLTIIRNGQKQDITVSLGKRPS